MTIQSLLNGFAEIGQFTLPIFVFFTMFNVGLTQDMEDITEYLKKWKFHTRVVLANYIIGPIIAYLLIQVFSLETPIAVGLLIFSMCAGAPFMIKLVNLSGNDVALGASLMLVLVLMSVIYVPIMLPLVSEEITVDAWGLFTNLFRQLVIPVILGAAVKYFFTQFSETIQPWVAKLGSISLWIVIIGTMVGNAEGMIDLAGGGTILAGVLFILGITVVGYFSGGKDDQNHLREVAAIGSGQRNTAASMLIAANNFPQVPEIFLFITVVNMIGILIHLVLTRMMSKNVSKGFI